MIIGCTPSATASSHPTLHVAEREGARSLCGRAWNIRDFGRDGTMCSFCDAQSGVPRIPYGAHRNVSWFALRLMQKLFPHEPEAYLLDQVTRHAVEHWDVPTNNAAEWRDVLTRWLRARLTEEKTRRP